MALTQRGKVVIGVAAVVTAVVVVLAVLAFTGNAPAPDPGDRGQGDGEAHALPAHGRAPSGREGRRWRVRCSR